MKGCKRILIICSLLLVSEVFSGPVRIKEIATIRGITKTQIVGYSLVVGLDGTGDGRRSLFTQQSIQNMLQRFGIAVSDKRIYTRNVAAVMVTAELSPFAKKGSVADITVSSMGDASSLEGGTLLMTPLMDKNGETYAYAQGNVSIGGLSIETISGEKYRKNYALVGRVPSGAIVEKETSQSFSADSTLTLQLRNPDFTTALRVGEAIDMLFGNAIANAIDAATVVVQIPDDYKGPNNLVRMIAMLESAEVEVDQIAKVIINERTGTVVVGGNVKLLTAAICHGPLTIRIRSMPIVSQPSPFSQRGETVVVPTTMTEVNENRQDNIVVLNEPASVSDLANSLNSMKVSARDLISIFQALKQAGALQAELVII